MKSRHLCSRADPLELPGQTRLVEFIQALKDLSGSKTVQMDSWGKPVIWLNLPLLGPEMTEHDHGMQFKFSYCFASDLFSVALLQTSTLEDTSGAQEAIHSYTPTQLCSIRSTSHAERSR